MLAIQLVFLVFLAIAVWLLLKAGQHMENPARHRRVVLVAAGALTAMILVPPIWRAFAEDWVGALTTLGSFALAVVLIGGYAAMVRRAHQRARDGSE